MAVSVRSGIRERRVYRGEFGGDKPCPPRHALLVKTTRKEFGQRLRELRVGRGATLKGLARALGVDHSFLGRIERGVVGAPESLIRAISRELDCPSEPLLILGGYLPEDIHEILRAQPERAVAVLRKALGNPKASANQEAG